MLEQRAPDPFDLLVIGGGINGCGIARDAAGRGLKVMLVEQGDLAQGTSSASTKLIHGGLRYLEQFEFRLVREALQERERLLNSAPHIIWPLRFVLPHDRGIRPAWLVRLGLFLYDHLATRERLPGCETLRLGQHPFGKALQPRFQTGFAYSDCAVDDSRLVVLCAIDAKERGAEIATRTRFLSGRRGAGFWEVVLKDVDSGKTRELRARGLVNAAGPWVAEVLGTRLGVASSKKIRLIKGSHLVTRRLYEGEHAYILQNPDKRIVFTIPYENDFTLIGTTDVAFHGEPHEIRISEEETRYLCDSVALHLRTPVAAKDIVWTYAGVRPLYDDGSVTASVVTRDYVFDLDAPRGAPPALTVFGGKITTFRRLSEHAMEALSRFFPRLQSPWTARATLPGGDLPHADFDAFLLDVKARWPFLEASRAHRLARAYGTRLEAIIGGARAQADLGRDFGEGLSEAEIAYLMRAEWARNVDDIVWRRSKLGLRLPQSAIAEIARYLERAGPRSPRRRDGTPEA